MWPVRAQAPPVEAMGRFYPHSARRRPRLGRSVDGPLAWMNLIQWNNEYIYNVSITTGVGEGGLLRLLSPGSLGFQVAWDFRLDGGGRLQAVDEVRCALRVTGRGED